MWTDTSLTNSSRSGVLAINEVRKMGVSATGVVLCTARRRLERGVDGDEFVAPCRSENQMLVHTSLQRNHDALSRLKSCSSHCIFAISPSSFKSRVSSECFPMCSVTRKVFEMTESGARCDVRCGEGESDAEGLWAWRRRRASRSGSESETWDSDDVQGKEGIGKDGLRGRTEH